MNNELTTIRQRAEAIRCLLDNFGGILDSLPKGIPDAVKIKIKDAINNAEFKDTLDRILDARPPRFVVIGRSGVGKSSFINALIGSYVARVSNVKVGTKEFAPYDITKDGEVLMSIIDSRGIGESENPGAAEGQLLSEMEKFTPDALLLLVSSGRDWLDKDIAEAKKICDMYQEKCKGMVKLPVFLLINKVDEVAPPYERRVDEYSEQKKQNIEDVKAQVKQIAEKIGLSGLKDVIPINSYIVWARPDDLRTGLDEKDIEKLDASEKEKLKICYDGRYNIDTVSESLMANLPDIKAQNGVFLVCRFKVILHEIASSFTNRLAAVGGVVAVTPIPFSDIGILWAIEGVLVMFIALLGGRQLNVKSGIEFAASLGIVGGVGFGLQQAAKMLNFALPGVGSAISAGIAVAGVKAIGWAAEAYYLQGKSIEQAKEEARKIFDSNKNKKQIADTQS